MAQVCRYNRTYDEAVDLMVEAKTYLSSVDVKERRKISATSGVRLSCEALRVTSRLTQVVAWLLMQRAVQEGELSVIEALSEPNRLSSADVCLNVAHCRDDVIPIALQSLLERSLHLYLRIAHIEAQIIARSEFKGRCSIGGFSS